MHFTLAPHIQHTDSHSLQFHHHPFGVISLASAQFFCLGAEKVQRFLTLKMCENMLSFRAGS